MQRGPVVRTLIGATVIVAVIGGCSSGEQPSTSSAPSAGATGSDTTAGSLASAVYPYTMTWPADELESKWRSADSAWDGTSRVDHGNEYTDYVRTADGHLFAFGYATATTAEQFEALVAEQAAEWHGCDAAATEQEALAVDGTDGILTTYQCGPTPVLRWVGVRHRHGGHPSRRR